MNVAQLTAVLRADASQFTRAIKGAGSDMVGFRKMAESVGRSMTMKLTLPLAISGAAAIKLAGDFEKSMRLVAAMTNNTSADVQRMRGQILDLSVETGRSANELAQALYFVASAGVEVRHQMQVVEMAAKGAAAGMGESADIARVLAAAHNAFGSSLEGGIAGAMDALVRAVNEGTAEASEYATVLGNVIPIAAEMGVAFRDTVAAVSSMTLTGATAGEAVTQLTQIFNAFLKPSGQAEKMMKRVGLSFEDVRAGMSTDLLGTLQSVSEAFGANESEIAKLLGRKEALLGFLALTGQNTKAVEGVFKRTRDTSGDLNEAYREMAEDSLTKLVKAYRGFERVIIENGKTLGNWAAAVATVFTPVFNLFLAIPGPIRTAALALLAVVAAAGPLLLIGAKILQVWNWILWAKIIVSARGTIMAVLAELRGGFAFLLAQIKAAGGLVPLVMNVISGAVIRVGSIVSSALRAASTAFYTFAATIQATSPKVAAQFTTMGAAAARMSAQVQASSQKAAGSLLVMGASAQKTGGLMSKLGGLIKAGVGIVAVIAVGNLIAAFGDAKTKAQELVSTFTSAMTEAGPQAAITGLRKRMDELAVGSRRMGSAFGDAIGLLKGEADAMSELKAIGGEIDNIRKSADFQTGATKELTLATADYLDVLHQIKLEEAKPFSYKKEDFEGSELGIRLFRELKDKQVDLLAIQEEVNGATDEGTGSTKALAEELGLAGDESEDTGKKMRVASGIVSFFGKKAGEAKDNFKEFRNGVSESVGDIGGVFDQMVDNVGASTERMVDMFESRAADLRTVRENIQEAITKGLDPRAVTELYERAALDPKAVAKLSQRLVDDKALRTSVNKGIRELNRLGVNYHGDIVQWKKWGADAFDPLANAARRIRRRLQGEITDLVNERNTLNQTLRAEPGLLSAMQSEIQGEIDKRQGQINKLSSAEDGFAGLSGKTRELMDSMRNARQPTQNMTDDIGRLKGQADTATRRLNDVKNTLLDIAKIGEINVTLESSGVQKGGDGLGSIMTLGAVGGSAAKMANAAMAAVPGPQSASGYRSPAVNAAVGGAPNSYHMDILNPAQDISGSNLMGIFNFIRGRYGSNVRELIYTPAGYSLINGSVVPPVAAADHYDHVHVADLGGIFRGPGLVRMGAGLEKFMAGGLMKPATKIRNLRPNDIKGGDGAAAPWSVGDLEEAMVRAMRRTNNVAPVDVHDNVFMGIEDFEKKLERKRERRAVLMGGRKN